MATIETEVLATLTGIRNAIAAYQAANGDAVPGADGQQATLISDLDPHMVDPFPTCPVANMNANVNMQNSGHPLAPPSVTGAQGWAYAYNNGKIIVNSSQLDGEGTPWNFY